jgi:hypothetical protein
VYAGRPGPLGNPFKTLPGHYLPQHRKEVIDKFATWFTCASGAKDLRDATAALPDAAVLECWCHPLPCHAQVIADFENERRGLK